MLLGKTHNVDHLSGSEQSALASRLGWCLPREMVWDVECTPDPKVRWSRGSTSVTAGWATLGRSSASLSLSFLIFELGLLVGGEARHQIRDRSAAAAAAKSLQSCPTLCHRRQPTRLPRPWDSPER